MSISTFAELKTSVASWLNRSDLTAQIPDFITLAEVRINRDVAKMSLVGLEKRATADTTSGDAYLATPSRMLSVKSLKINTNPVRVLQYMTPDTLSRTYNSAETGIPKAYTVIGDEIKFGPAPDGVYSVEINYCARETPLSTANTTNWFMANTPDLLLYGALLEAEPFMKNDERIQVWTGMYSAGMESLENMNKAIGFPSGLEIKVL